jgi:hypothetical protein
MVTTVVASSLGGVGAILLAMDSPGNWRDSDGMPGLLIGIPMLSVGLVLAAVGVPVWVGGTRGVAEHCAPENPWAAPPVAVSPRAGALVIEF